MNIINNSQYIEDLDYVANLDLPWEKLQDKHVLISGATGLVGSFMIDVLMRKNEAGLNCLLYALNRNATTAKKRFSPWRDSRLLKIISCDINKPIDYYGLETIEYVLHLASNTHPFLYSTDPIGTITTNIVGLHNMLELAVDHHAIRFVFTSSNEIYGENRGDVELFDEKYCGYIDCNTLRAGYPESKRCGEALCQAYRSQKGLDIVIPRITRTYGPTMLMSDTKAISQFIKKGIEKEDIVLKSAGNQFYSYTYVADAASGLLYVLLKGVDGEAYNIADEKSDIKMKALAYEIALLAGVQVIFEKPDIIEAKGYSKATKARLDGKKARELGWSAKYNIRSGIERTLSILMKSNDSE